ncbi:MAG: M28 family peptidase [Acidobacteriota bacterium]|nr:M28 family peptidase [Acidobacteriota bacterium]
MTRPVLLLAILIAVSCTAARPAPVLAPSTSSLPPVVERAYGALASRFDEAAAMEVVTFMQQYWRLAGNPGFDASIDHIRARLVAAKLPVVRVDEYPNGGPAWDYSRGTLTIDGESAPVLSREKDGVSLVINSFSTPPGGAAVRLVDVGAGTAADFTGKDVKGAVVLGDAALGALWREAVRNRGAAGVVSTQIAAYIRPGDVQKMDEAHKDVLQWGSVPYDEKAKAFGFKASWRAATRLRDALRTNPSTTVRVDIVSSFHTAPARTLVAEITGRTAPDQRIVLVAHVQEPGANDNASGSGTLLSTALALNDAIARGAIAPPERTLTFLWVDEIRGSRQWITSRPQEAKGVRYMFSMDMTGQDTAKTGGTFLIEKQADPSAAWERPSDPHSEWGGGEVKPETLRGSLLNDLHLAVAQRRARDTGWVVRTNPYEGGSDHTVFAGSGVPSLLNWHFTDRFYHTNQDTIDKVSAAEMEHVGITVATSAYALASAGQDDAMAVVDLLESAARSRLRLEREQGPAVVAAAKDKVAAEKIEAQVVAAWIKWYGEALDSVGTLATTQASPALLERIRRARESIK